MMLIFWPDMGVIFFKRLLIKWICESGAADSPIIENNSLICYFPGNSRDAISIRPVWKDVRSLVNERMAQ
jgi:hypothetical protein